MSQRSHSTEGATAYPDLTQLARWTRRTARRRRRLLRSVSEDFTDIYTLIVGLILGSVIAWRIISITRPHAGQGEITSRHGDAFGALSLMSPQHRAWFLAAVLLILLACSVGMLRRLGPIVLRPAQMQWWLATPGGRSRLFARRLTLEVLFSCLIAALLAIFCLLLAPGVAPVWAWFLLAWGALLYALADAASLQVGVRHRTLIGARPVLLTAALVCVLGELLTALPTVRGLWLGSESSVLVVTVTLMGVLLGVKAALTLLIRVRPQLHMVDDAALTEATRRLWFAGAAALSMDTRSLSRFIAPPPRPRRRASALPLARHAARWPASIRVVGVIAQADWLLMRSQLWRVGQLAFACLLVPLVLLEGVSWVVETLVFLVSLWLCLLAGAEPTRRIWCEGSAEETLPVGPQWVRVGHLIVPTLCALPWAGMVTVALASRVGWLPAVAGALLLAVGTAASCVRLGTRKEASWMVVIPTPAGAIPAGLIDTIRQGADTALLVAAPVLLTLLAGRQAQAFLLMEAAVCAIALYAAVGREH